MSFFNPQNPGIDVGIGNLTPSEELFLTNLAGLSWTQGSIPFISSSGYFTQDNSNLFWDDTNDRLGIGTSSPTARIDVKGETTTAVLGPEMITLAADRDFSSDTGNWTGTNWTIGGGVATHTAGANDFTLNISALTTPPVNGSFYKVSYSVTTIVAGTSGVYMQLGGNQESPRIGKVIGTVSQTCIITAGNSNGLVFGVGDATWTGTIDNISVKLITSSRATQILRNSNGSISVEIRTPRANSFFVGNSSGRFDTTLGSNTSFGSLSLKNNISGSGNVAFGFEALTNNTTGNTNLAFGDSALRLNTVGFQNTAIGASSMSNNISGANNTAIGTSSMQLNSTGADNTGIGLSSLIQNTSGNFNVAIGNNALSGNTVGEKNITVGYKAGDNITTGSTNIVIGYDIDAPSATGSNQMTIGNLIYATGLGATGTTVSSGLLGIGVVAPSARLHVVQTTEQLRVGYDASNYYSTTVSSAGAVTFDAVGASAGFTFNDDVSVPDEAYGAGWNGSLEVPTKNAVYDKIETITGASGSFTTADAKTVTVVNGLITSIV